jgi:hypothetical protein
MQEKYWLMMTQIRFDIHFAGRYLAQSIRFQRWMKIIAAVASSIAEWLIWEDLKIVWAVILAI